MILGCFRVIFGMVSGWFLFRSEKDIQKDSKSLIFARYRSLAPLVFLWGDRAPPRTGTVRSENGSWQNCHKTS